MVMHGACVALPSGLSDADANHERGQSRTECKTLVKLEKEMNLPRFLLLPCRVERRK